jgi:FkbM family methyltransferase
MNTPDKLILIDCGYHIGSYTKQFLESNRCDKIYGFEPLDIEGQVIYNNVTLYKSAVWVKDEMRSIFLCDNIEASSLIENHVHLKGSKRSIVVQCVDFNRWLLENFKLNEQKIHLKLDIESAEYDVLSSMIDGGSIKLINKLVCEWHKPNKNRKHELIKKIKQLGIDYKPWH